jgi:uncharacterized glyoxalase superfamily protein PhnB
MNLMIGNLQVVLEFTSPEVTDIKKSDPTGVGFNIDVDDVKQIYEDMVTKGAEIVIPLEEDPWGEIVLELRIQMV